MTDYLVFLDIDGVFTSSRAHESERDPHYMWTTFDPVAVSFMNTIHDAYSVEFVLMTTWKKTLNLNSEATYHWIVSAFRNAGFRGTFAEVWKTNPYNAPELERKDRAYEVKDYFEKHHTPVTDFLLFDDTRYRFNEVLGIKRFIQTDPTNGLLHKHMLNAKSLMGTWEKR